MQGATSEGKSPSNTRVANVVRYRPSGVLFARARIKGKLIRRSLKTKSISVAKLGLVDLEKQERQLQHTRTTSPVAG